MEQRHARRDDPRGEILGQLAPDRGVGQPGVRGEELFDLTAHVGGVPRRPRSAPSRDNTSAAASSRSRRPASGDASCSGRSRSR